MNTNKLNYLLYILIVAIGVFGSFNVSAGINDGLLAYWSFNDCTAKDISGNGRDGVIKNNVTCTAGVNLNPCSVSPNPLKIMR